jgi:hypothetical protein
LAGGFNCPDCDDGQAWLRRAKSCRRISYVTCEAKKLNRFSGTGRAGKSFQICPARPEPWIYFFLKV